MPKRKKSKSPKVSLRTKILLVLGLILILIPSIFYLNQTIQLMYVVPEVPEAPAPADKPAAPLPTEVNIPRIRLSLPIEEAAIKNNTWEVAGTGVSHLNVSASPGEKAPIILYAHNTRQRFGPIRWLKKGDDVSLMTSDKKTHKYLVTRTVTVSPDKLSVFFSRKDETLYLFTCDGFADLKRFIVIAEPVTASSSAR